MPTSNASLAWADCDYVVHAAQMTNSSSPQPPRTSGNWPRSFPHRSKREKPDRKGARARFGMAISALANVCFSTESASCCRSPHRLAPRCSSAEPAIHAPRSISASRDPPPTSAARLVHAFICHRFLPLRWSRDSWASLLAPICGTSARASRKMRGAPSNGGRISVACRGLGYPVNGGFVVPPEIENGGILTAMADQLQPHGRAGGAETGGDTQCRKPG